MLYAVATHSFLVTVELDADWRLRDYAVLGSGYHYGIAVVGGDPTQAFGRQPDARLVVYRGGKSATQQDDPRLVFYASGRRLEAVDSIVPEAIGDVHQLASANGGIYLANTRHNCLVYQSLDGRVRQAYVFDGASHDRNHLNSVFPCGDQVFVLLHNLGRQESEIVVLEHHPSEGFVARQRLSLWHEACHNVFFDDRLLFYNASPVRKLVVVDLAEEYLRPSLSFGGPALGLPASVGHAKGLSATSDHLVIGLSEHTHRDRRSTSRGYLAVVDRRSLVLLAIVDLNFPSLPHPIGNINEIRCLSGGELAQARPHRSKLSWAGMRLGQKNPWAHAWRRARARALTPLRRMRRRTARDRGSGAAGRLIEPA